MADFPGAGFAENCSKWGLEHISAHAEQGGPALGVLQGLPCSESLGLLLVLSVTS